MRPHGEMHFAVVTVRFDLSDYQELVIGPGQIGQLKTNENELANAINQ